MSRIEREIPAVGHGEPVQALVVEDEEVHNAVGGAVHVGNLEGGADGEGVVGHNITGIFVKRTAMIREYFGITIKVDSNYTTTSAQSRCTSHRSPASILLHIITPTIFVVHKVQ